MGPRKGLSYRVRKAKEKPSNTSMQDLLANRPSTKAALNVLETAKAGVVKEGILGGG